MCHMYWYAEQSRDGETVDIAIAAAQQAASRRAAESRAQAAMMVEAVEDRAYEVFSACRSKRFPLLQPVAT